MPETPDTPTPTPPTPAVERAARALYAYRFSEWVQRNKLPEFTGLAEREQEAFRLTATAVLKAIGHDALVRDRDGLRRMVDRCWGHVPLGARATILDEGFTDPSALSSEEGRT